MIDGLLDKVVNNSNSPIQVLIYMILFGLGAILLVKFCSIFLGSASYIAKRFKIPSIIIGLTIVAIGTSIPELAVSISDSLASLKDGTSANISFSNVVGSNISNLLLVLSFDCLFYPIIIKKENKKEYIIMTCVAILLLILALLFGDKEILRLEGLLLIFIMIAYVVYIVMNAKKNIKESVEEEVVKESLIKNIIIILSSILVIAIGGELVVYGAKGISLKISSSLSINNDIAETLIGLTIVAVGTSLPELVTTIIAAKKGENDMALGNVIGSNIFNIVFVLGFSSVIAPFSIAKHMIIDLIVMVLATILVLAFVVKGKLTKKHSICLIVTYCLYVIYLIIRTI